MCKSWPDSHFRCDASRTQHLRLGGLGAGGKFLDSLFAVMPKQIEFRYAQELH